MQIFKYKLLVVDLQFVELPAIHKILTVQEQFNVPCIWVEQNEKDSVEKVKVPIYTITTGSDFSNENIDEYIGTYQLNSGQFIGHVYRGESISLKEAKDSANISM